MASLPEFSAQQLERISRIIGATDDGLSGSAIGALLRNLGFPDEGSAQTKWIRIYNSLVALQNTLHVGNHTIKLVNEVMRPEAYVSERHLFESRQRQLNVVLSFAGYYVRDDGRVGLSQKARTLDEAFARASRMSDQLRSRNVHEKVLEFCKAELVNSNYFHAVFEAMKSIKSRINDMSGISGDGAQLVDEVFGIGGGPAIAINALRNSTDEGEQRGFANLLKGLFGMVRNPLAHNAKVEWEMSEQDALDILTTLSLVHRKLDKAFVRRGT